MVQVAATATIRNAGRREKPTGSTSWVPYQKILVVDRPSERMTWMWIEKPGDNWTS